MKISEKELIKKAKQGDQRAMAQIVKQYERMIYNLGLKLLGNQEEAECVLQDTFLKVLQSLHGFKENSQLSTWIYRIASNQALMKLRTRKRQYTSSILTEDNNSNDYSDFNKTIDKTPLHDLLNSELKEKMKSAIDILPPKYKSVFVLKDVEGLSLKEVSSMLSLSLPAVKSNLHRARIFLREKLSEFTYEK